MSEEITQRELRNNSGKIMNQLDSGKKFVVTRNGVHVGELIPIRSRREVAKETVLAAFAGIGTDYSKLRADLDSVVDPYV